MQNLAYFERIQELIAHRQPFVSVTLVAVRGHAPQEVGAKILVTREGLAGGTIGGGKVEAKAIEAARARLAAKGLAPAELVTWNLQRDVGMSCGGEVTLFFEASFHHPWRIAVFGAGHVAQALVRVLVTLDCEVSCHETRAEWLDKLPSAANLRKLLVTDLARAATDVPPDSFVMLMTQGHSLDLPVLVEVLRTREPPYVGVIGSPVKAQVLRRELAAAGIAPERIERLRCPMGLQIGDSTPAEIAISMAAEVLEARDRLAGR